MAYTTYKYESERRRIVQQVLMIKKPGAKVIAEVTGVCGSAADTLNAVMLRKNQIVDKASAKNIVDEVTDKYWPSTSRKALVELLALTIAGVEGSSTNTPQQLDLSVEDVDVKYKAKAKASELEAHYNNLRKIVTLQNEIVQLERKLDLI